MNDESICPECRCLRFRWSETRKWWRRQREQFQEHESQSAAAAVAAEWPVLYSATQEPKLVDEPAAGDHYTEVKSRVR